MKKNGLIEAMLSGAKTMANDIEANPAMKQREKLRKAKKNYDIPCKWNS